MTRMRHDERKTRPKGREFHLSTGVVKEAVELPRRVARWWWWWRMTLVSDTKHGAGAIFAQLEDDRQVERSAIYRTCCIRAVLRRICGRLGPLKIKYSAPRERTHSCCLSFWPSNSYDEHPKVWSNKWNWAEDESTCGRRRREHDRLQILRRKGRI